MVKAGVPQLQKRIILKVLKSLTAEFKDIFIMDFFNVHGLKMYLTTAWHIVADQVKKVLHPGKGLKRLNGIWNLKRC